MDNKEKARLNIKQNLWQWNHRVVDMQMLFGGNHPYDLLVDGKLRVKTAWVKTFKTVNFPVELTDCDILAIFIDGKNASRLYSLGFDLGDGKKLFSKYLPTINQILNTNKQKKHYAKNRATND